MAQRDSNCEAPDTADLQGVGTIATIRHVVRLPDDTTRVLCDGVERALLLKVEEKSDYAQAEVSSMEIVDHEDDLQTQAYANRVKQMVRDFFMMKGKLPGELLQQVQGIDEPGQLADVAAANTFHRMEDKQAVLECRDVRERLYYVLRTLASEIAIARLEQGIEQKVNENVERTQKEYYLREQIHVIREELGEDDEQEIDGMRKRLSASAMGGEAREKVEREIHRYERMAKGSPETAISENYIDWMLDMPWGKLTRAKIDIPRARKVLDADHYGLEKVKRRILEFLAVRELKDDMKGPILCLVGPPGVGKTSIAKSVARALKREFVRVSLGGVRDEAEIRGHRRTYIGAMPGRIVSEIKKCGAMDPVFLFDEIDKMASDFRGDPASAMLEALDPEQNASFTDHYLDAPFDLSKVLFITTANSEETIPQPLLDRMELIEVPSYTLEEKVQIAKRHLWGKQLKENGLTRAQARMNDKAIREVAEKYTREAGVRGLERELGAICRKIAVRIAETPEEERALISVKPENVAEFLGAPRYLIGETERQPEVGVVNGLAWTSVGGTTMPIEVAVMPGDGALDLTGRLGDVMKESARTAYSYIRSQSDVLRVPVDFHKKNDLHIHVPEGAVPKDGPSAGVALTCALVSAITNAPARQDVAMTGEVTLRGRVLPIGGVKEKLLAAHRMGIDTILLPKENEKDLSELPEDVRAQMDVKLIGNVAQALTLVLNQPCAEG